MNNISFQGSTSFYVSPTAYKKVEGTARKAYTNLTRLSDRRLTGSVPCVLNTDPACLTVVVKSEKDGFFKYIPIEDGIEDFINDVSKNIDRLKDSASKKPLTAWILGGTNINGKKGGKIIEVLNQIADVVCDRPDIDASILVGSKTGEEKFILRPGVQQLKMALDKKINPKADVESELQNMFDVVELNNTNLYYSA